MRRRPARPLAKVAATAAILIVGPLAGVASAQGGSVRIFVGGGNVVWAEAQVDDTGDLDHWHDAWVEETVVQPWNLVCASQGYRDLRLENSGPNWFYYEGIYSGFKASCVYGRWVDFPDRWTGEEWDMRFAWKSNHTSNPAYGDFVEVGTVDA